MVTLIDFFFDAKGRFIEGYYLDGLLAEVMPAKKFEDNLLPTPYMEHY